MVGPPAIGAATIGSGESRSLLIELLPHAFVVKPKHAYRGLRWKSRTKGVLGRSLARRHRNDGLDPEVDYEKIARNLSLYEFPWDSLQSLSLALFRTYAVPNIGRLLASTGEFETATQKRHDDTALLLEIPTANGLNSFKGTIGDPSHQPDAPPVRHLKRRHALCAVDICRRPEALD